MIIWRNNFVTVFQSSLYMTLSAVIETEDMVMVVDPTWLPHEVEEIRQHAAAVRRGRPLYLLFTHSDYDHILGYTAFPDAMVIASKAFAIKSEEDKEEIIEQIKTFDDEYYIIRDNELIYPQVDIQTEFDGELLQVGDTRIVFYQAPGHNRDGIFSIVEPLGILIAGDYFSDIEFPYIYVSSDQYVESLHKLDYILDKHQIRLLIPGHGSISENHNEMKRRKRESLDYIDAMRLHIRRDEQTAIDNLIVHCPFPRNMSKFHSNNQQLMKKEQNSKETKL
jgi:glyoxylase-like metal-dependent hydrolase (beta-lactamase superfamily II)